MYLVGEDDKTLQGTIPKWLFMILEREPRKEPIAIGQEQTVYTQVTTYCHQSVFLTKMRIWKPQFII